MGWDRAIWLVAAFFLVVSCKREIQKSGSLPPPNVPIMELKPCVKIFYDREGGPYSPSGYIYALMLGNLVSHYPELQKQLIPIDNYVSGMLNECPANFYIGSNYYARLPLNFLAESMANPNAFVWMGYNIAQSGSAFPLTFGHQFEGLTKLNPIALDRQGFPSFFSEINYKNRIFNKIAHIHPNGHFSGAYEMSVLAPTFGAAVAPQANVIALARNPVSGEILPYVLKQQNKYYFADVPMTYMHETDRVMILADLLGEILRTPQPNSTVVGGVHPQVGLVFSISTQDPLNEHGINLLQELDSKNIPYFLSVAPGIEESVNLGFAEILKKLIAQSQGLLWDLRYLHSPSDLGERPASEYVSDLITQIRKQQQYFLKQGFHPMATFESESNFNSFENFTLSQIFPVVVGRSQVFDINLAPFGRSRLADSNRTDFFPINESQLDSMAATNVQAIDPFHQAQFMPFQVYNDVFGQTIFPLLTKVNAETDNDLNRFNAETLSVLNESLHFIAMDLDSASNAEKSGRLLELIHHYQNYDYRLLSQERFKILLMKNK
jgi:hypothetical protein